MKEVTQECFNSPKKVLIEIMECYNGDLKETKYIEPILTQKDPTANVLFVQGDNNMIPKDFGPNDVMSAVFNFCDSTDYTLLPFDDHNYKYADCHSGVGDTDKFTLENLTSDNDEQIVAITFEVNNNKRKDDFESTAGNPNDYDVNECASHISEDNNLYLVNTENTDKEIESLPNDDNDVIDRDRNLLESEDDTDKMKYPSISKELNKRKSEINMEEAGMMIKEAKKKVVPQTSKQLKKYPCYYCGQQETTMSRHYMIVHKNEAIIQRLEGTKAVRRAKNVPMTDEQKYRAEIFDYLRKQAIAKHNLTADLEAPFLTVRRPKTDKLASDFAMCSNCKGFYMSSSLHKHAKRCFQEPDIINRPKMLSNMLMGKLNANISDHLHTVLLPIREGNIKDIIMNDYLILEYGNSYAFKHRHSPHLGTMIRSRLRLLARVLLKLRNITDKIKQFSDFLPDLYATPAPASAAGAYVKELADIWIVTCIKQKNSSGKNDALDFLALYNESFSKIVNKTVLVSQIEIKKNKKICLPEDDDIKKFYLYTEDNLNRTMNRLNNGEFSINRYYELGEFLLMRLQFFNARRAGEIERLKLSDWENLESLDKNCRSYNDLSVSDKNFLKQFHRMLIRGKLYRTVPVILTDLEKQGLELYVSLRTSKAKIHEKNKYIFGIKGSDSNLFRHLRACDILQKHSTECGAKYPERLRGTLFRKNISTLCMSLNLTENQRTDLYQCLGHSENINKNVYAQHEFQRQVLSIAPVLLQATRAFEKGDVNNDVESDSENENENNDEHDELDLPEVNSHNKPVNSNTKADVLDTTSRLLSDTAADSYEEASFKVSIAQITSDVETEYAKSQDKHLRKVRSVKVIVALSSSDEEPAVKKVKSVLSKITAKPPSKLEFGNIH